MIKIQLKRKKYIYYKVGYLQHLNRNKSAGFCSAGCVVHLNCTFPCGFFHGPIISIRLLLKQLQHVCSWCNSSQVTPQNGVQCFADTVGDFQAISIANCRRLSNTSLLKTLCRISAVDKKNFECVIISFPEPPILWQAYINTFLWTHFSSRKKTCSYFSQTVFNGQI